jgi:hypothetical protein
VLIGSYENSWYGDAPSEVVVRRLHPSLAVDTSFGTAGKALVANYKGGAGLWEVYHQRLDVLRDDSIRFSDDMTLKPSFLSDIAFYQPYLSGGGAPGIAPLPDSQLDPQIGDWRFVGLLPDGSVYLDGFYGKSPLHYKLLKLLPGSQPDPAFGNAGTLSIDYTTAGRFTLTSASPDGRYLYVAQENDPDAAGPPETVVTRIELLGVSAGQVDTSFGQNGMVWFGSAPGLTAMQATADGSVLLVYGARTIRLVGSQANSPGLVSFVGSSQNVFTSGQAAVEISVKVSRDGGSDGPLAVDYATRQVANNSAVSGKDYVPVNGRLTWADGETADKTVSITILPGTSSTDVVEYLGFALDLSNQSSGLWIESPTYSVTLWRYPYGYPNTPGSSSPGSSGSGSSSSGGSGSGSTSGGSQSGTGQASYGSGGGAFDLVTLLVLCGGASGRAWQRSRRRAARGSVG